MIKPHISMPMKFLAIVAVSVCLHRAGRCGQMGFREPLIESFTDI